jgi:predicted naringenin-chalcone synthase
VIVLADPTSAPRGASLHRRPAALLLGVGTAVPDVCWTQQESAQRFAQIWNLQDAALGRWQRIVAGSGISKRHGVMSPDEVVPLTTAQRMNAYERYAPPLAERAACRALQAAGIEPRRITDLVIVSCTGFSAPGLDVALIERLNLKPTTRRTTIGFMGCFGGINGLRIASALCTADENAVVLLVCAELCSLHMRRESDVQNQVASALFADGAAAAVLGNERRAGDAAENGEHLARIGQSASLLLPEGREWMTWRITDAGFAMTLTRDVPVALRNSVAQFVRDLGAPPNATFIVHPGGPGVLDAVDDALQLGDGLGLECSRRILRDFGNMSSGTVLFVLQEALQCAHALPAVLLAFGPGLTIEGLLLHAPTRAGD